MAFATVTRIGEGGGAIRPLTTGGGPQLIQSDPKSFSDTEISKQLAFLRTRGAQQPLKEGEMGLFQALSDEQRRRQLQSAGGLTDILTNIVKGGSGGVSQGVQLGGSGTSQPSANSSIIDRITESINKSREGLTQQYGTARQQALQQLQETLAPQRQRLVAEQAALGRLRSGVGAQSLGQFDIGAQKAASNVLAQLSQQEAAEQVALEEALRSSLETGARFEDELALKRQQLGLQAQQLSQQERIALAQLISDAIRSEKSYGLEERKISGTEEALARQDLRSRQGIELAQEIGRLQAAPEESSTFTDIIGSLTSGAQLVGGLSSLTSGLKGLKGLGAAGKATKATAGTGGLISALG